MIRRSLYPLRSFRSTVLPLGYARQFQISSRLNIVNPLLPFDLLEDLDNEDLEEANKKLKKEKKKIIKEKKKIEKEISKESNDSAAEKTAGELADDEFKTENDSIPLKKAVSTEVKQLEIETLKVDEKTKSANTANESASSAAGSGSGSGSGKPDKSAESARSTGSNQHSTSATTAAPGSTGSPGSTSLKHSESSYEEDTTDSKPDTSSDDSSAVGSGSSASVSGVGNGGSPPDKPGNSNTANSEDENSENEKKKKEEKEKEKEKEEEEEDIEEDIEEEEPSRFRETMDKFVRFFFKCLETIGITFSSVAMLGGCGILYHKYYGDHVLDKIDMAFDVGDPAYQLSVHRRTNKHAEDEGTGDDGCDLSQYWAQRPQQALLDDIISGKIVGRYFLVIGEKGTGKTSLLLESMKKIDGYNVAIVDAHSDPEIFRLRLGKALNYAYNEDYIGSLFSIRGPRDTTALLDIERAFGKLEEMALQRITKTQGKPLVLIINNSHLIKDNEDGIKLIELLQQKAEGLSGSGLATMIFNSDDYWVYEKLKKLGTRLEVINVRDFGRKEATMALKFTREKNFPSGKFPQLILTDEVCNQIYDLIGGRPQHIAQVARHVDVFKASHEIIDREKTWFLNQCGLLGLEMDDDVMESGKFSTLAMLLMKEFVDMDRERRNTLLAQEYPDKKDESKDHSLPELPLWRARQIMTRADYIQQYDNLNIFTIDSESRVRADSVPMMRAFHELATHPHFDELLDDTIDRVAQIESLGRTREIVAKDLVEGGRYQMKEGKDGKNYVSLLLNSSKKGNDQKNGVGEGNNDDDDLLMEDITRSGHKKWWKQRMQNFDERYSPPKKPEYDIDINRDN